jgi:hypothetical protein
MMLGNIKVTVLPDQVAVPRAHEAFADDGSLKDPRQQASIQALGAALARALSTLHA